MKIQTILVPVDFSTCSMLVAQQGAQLAAQLGARLVILHMTELAHGLPAAAHLKSGGADQTVGELALGDARASLLPFAAAAKEAGVPVELLARLGPVVPGILAAAEESGADLILIGTHGRSGAARLVLGSVAEAVAHAAHVPVMLVRRETRPECRRASCDWCPHEGLSRVEEQIEAEQQG